jgi:hypothetical protein
VFILIPSFAVSSILYMWLAAAMLLYALFYLLDGRLSHARAS